MLSPKISFREKKIQNLKLYEKSNIKAIFKNGFLSNQKDFHKNCKQKTISK